MRCSHCETEPLTPGHYCECCGRKLSLDEIQVQETPPVPATERHEEEPAAKPAALCESCGGPAPDGDLCPACQQAFSSVLAGTTPSSHTAPEAETRPNNTIEIPNRVVPYVEPVQPNRLSRSAVVAIAAGLMIGAVGVPVGAGLIRARMPADIVAEKKPEQPAPTAVKTGAGARRTALPAGPAQPRTAAAEQRSQLTPRPVAVRTRPQAVASARATRGGSPSAKPGRQTSSTTPPTGTLAASPLIAASAQIAPALAPVPEPPAFAAPVPPAGRLFEPNEVDQAPRVEARVEPQLPGDLAGRPVNDVVVVRVLVSHLGHPSRVSLLRRSRLGSQVDDRVIAAVRQWTFQPAFKRGEPVSCWLHVGVLLKGD